MSRAAWSHRCAGVLLAVLTAASVAVGAAATADAHDVLISTSPADGARVATVPSTVTLRFNETVLGVGTEVAVSGPAGQVQLGKASVVDDTVTQRVQPGAAAGRYTVSWRVTSVDGHPVSGTFTFTATAAGQGTASPSSTASGATPSTGQASASSVPWFLLSASALLVALVVAAALWSRRRSRTGQPTRP